MRHAIVEGEPGIFPHPIAELMRKIGGLFTRGRRAKPPVAADEQTPDVPDDTNNDNS